MIEFKNIRDFSEFSSLKPIWNDFIHKHFPDAYHFDHDWLGKWWQCYASGENVFVFLAYKDSELKGIIPLLIRKENYGGFPVRRLGVLGMGFACEDFPVISEEQEIVSKVFGELRSLASWDIGNFARFSQKFCAVIKNALPERMIFEERDTLNPIIEVTGTYEDYFNSRSKNFRANYRKKTKRINTWGSVRIRHNESGSIEETIKMMEEIGRESWQGEYGVNLTASESGIRFLQGMVDNFFHRGIMDVAFIELDGKPIAYLLGARINKTYFAIETAYMQKYFDASPGMLLHLSVIEQRFTEKNRVSLLDFGYDAPYKRKWTDLNRPESQLTIYNRGVYPRFIHFIRRSRIYSKLLAMKRQ